MASHRQRMANLFMVILVVQSMLLMKMAKAQLNQPMMPAMFVLGDSLVDPGNNNYIATIAKSNWLPNGEDFPGGMSATGRFCNGRTVSDVVTQLMGLPYLPAYLDPKTTGTAVLKGVNYASAAGGILDGTGANYVGRLSLNLQLQYLENTMQQFSQILGPNEANDILSRSLYYLTIGSNDYINNYLLPISPSRSQYNPQQFEDLLISEYSKQITVLYNMGARKIFIFNVGPLGCIPSQLAQQGSPDGSCIEFVNGYVRSFNSALVRMIATLTLQLPGATFVYGNSYDLVYDKVINPGNYGLKNVTNGCCGVGNYNGQIPCIPLLETCANHNEFLFWDPFHPTDAVNVQLGNAFFSGPPSAISPMNIQQLASMP